LVYSDAGWTVETLNYTVDMEMRLKGRSGIARALYLTALGQRVVIVRAFVKKTQKTPRREIDLALSRAKSIQ
jgi:phage-related protein